MNDFHTFHKFSSKHQQKTLYFDGSKNLSKKSIIQQV